MKEANLEFAKEQMSRKNDYSSDLVEGVNLNVNVNVGGMNGNNINNNIDNAVVRRKAVKNDAFVRSKKIIDPSAEPEPQQQQQQQGEFEQYDNVYGEKPRTKRDEKEGMPISPKVGFTSPPPPPYVSEEKKNVADATAFNLPSKPFNSSLLTRAEEQSLATKIQVMVYNEQVSERALLKRKEEKRKEEKKIRSDQKYIRATTNPFAPSSLGAGPRLSHPLRPLVHAAARKVGRSLWLHWATTRQREHSPRRTN